MARRKVSSGERPGTSAEQIRHDVTLLTDDDIYLFNEGTHFYLYEKLGAHLMKVKSGVGTYFAVWAPNAEHISVIGDFNEWNKTSHPLRARGQSGVWEGFIPGVKKGTRYKYHIRSRHKNYRVDKADPFAFLHEEPPKTGSVVWGVDYSWADHEWMDAQNSRNTPNAPMAIYEVHLGSWMRVPEEGNRFLSYRELASGLAKHVGDMGFTHVEFLPVMEHPFYGSWGYETLGYFAPTSRYGQPQDLMYLIDCLHQHGIGVILDWVPSHFPNDEHGIGFFDGTHLFEHADPRQGIHPDWNSFIFNFGRNEVRSFLMSSALFWLDVYHADGLRVDAVASMLYLDYSRKDGQWVSNKYGGRENLEAIAFLRRFNEDVYKKNPYVQTIAEDSTAGFGMKWDMGCMHDTLEYMSKEPVHRKYHHNRLTFRFLYAFQENFVLPLSHDEVVHGKGSLLGKMHGDDWQKFANLRVLFAYQYAQPGKKLLFMGGEFGQWSEWDHDASLDWHLLDYPLHAGLKRWVADLNCLYREEPALHTLDFDPAGFEWIDCNDSQQSILSLIRQDPSSGNIVIVVCNFTPVSRFNYRVGAPHDGFWKEVLNSDGLDYGGTGHGNLGGVEASPISRHGRPYSLNLTVPPLGAVFLRNKRG
jgi:1,4-alpha-glucan branching enzyme